MSEDAEPQEVGSEVLVWGEDGRLLLAGEPAAVDAFLETFEPLRTLDSGTLRGAAGRGGGAAPGDPGGQHGRRGGGHDVESLRQLAEAAEMGNIAGLYRILSNARKQVDETGTISQATWDAIAVHEVTAQQGADHDRNHPPVAKLLPLRYGRDRAEGATQPCRRGATPRRVR